jgi:hypothetical protein
MPKYKVTKHHTLVTEYTTIVEAPYGSHDIIEEDDSAECVAEGIDMKHWDTNYKIIEEAFEFVDVEEVTTEPD